jgi:peptidoglycan-associated lipoprotein
MKTHFGHLSALSPVAALLVATACGGATQEHAAAPAPASPQAQAVATPSPAATPNTPTATNVQISNEILRACNIPDADAYFAFDSSRVTSFDHGPLDAVAVCFDRGPLAGHAMRLVGHADPRGPSDYNMSLGQERADSVAGYLAGRGLKRGAVSSTSRGAMDATGSDETGWAHDRRVDVLLAN